MYVYILSLMCLLTYNDIAIGFLALLIVASMLTVAIVYHASEYIDE